MRLEGIHPQWTALLKLDGWKTTPFRLEWHFFVCVLFVFAHGKAWSLWFNEVAMTFDLFSFFIPDDYYISFFVNPPKVSFACFSFWNTYLAQNLANVRHIVPFTKHLNMVTYFTQICVICFLQSSRVVNPSKWYEKWKDDRISVSRDHHMPHLFF